MSPLAVPAEQLASILGWRKIALERGQRGQPEQVVHALGGLGQQRHVRVGARAGDVVVPLGRRAPPHRLLEPAVLRGDVSLDADDRLDPGLGRLPVEVVGAVDVAVVGHGDRGHPGLPAGLEQAVEPGSAVEHRVLGVHVQVGEPAVTSASRAASRICRHEVPPPSGMPQASQRRGRFDPNPDRPGRPPGRARRSAGLRLPVRTRPRVPQATPPDRPDKGWRTPPSGRRPGARTPAGPRAATAGRCPAWPPAPGRRRTAGRLRTGA